MDFHRFSWIFMDFLKDMICKWGIFHGILGTPGALRKSSQAPALAASAAPRRRLSWLPCQPAGPTPGRCLPWHRQNCSKFARDLHEASGSLWDFTKWRYRKSSINRNGDEWSLQPFVTNKHGDSSPRKRGISRHQHSDQTTMTLMVCN